jgi:hypothetical protein
MDKLLVLDRYTGKLLLTIPWIVRNATMSVGAGYVVIASAPGGEFGYSSSRSRARALLC